MARSLHPKEVFAASLMELSPKKSLTKIRVKDIVDNCDLSKQTFYRCFKDKYDLINWIIKKDLDKLNRELEKDFSTYKEILIKLLCTIRNEKEFYTVAFKMTGQNVLTDFFIEHCVIYSKKVFCDNVIDQKIKEKMMFQFRFSAYGTVYCIKDWVLTGMTESPDHIGKMIIEAMPMEIRKLYETSIAPQ